MEMQGEKVIHMVKKIQKTEWETHMSEFCSQPRFQNCHYQLSLYDNKKCSKPSKTSVS